MLRSILKNVRVFLFSCDSGGGFIFLLGITSLIVLKYNIGIRSRKNPTTKYQKDGRYGVNKKYVLDILKIQKLVLDKKMILDEVHLFEEWFLRKTLEVPYSAETQELLNNTYKKLICFLDVRRFLRKHCGPT